MSKISLNSEGHNFKKWDKDTPAIDGPPTVTDIWLAQNEDKKADGSQDLTVEQLLEAGPVIIPPELRDEFAAMRGKSFDELMAEFNTMSEDDFFGDSSEVRPTRKIVKHASYVEDEITVQTSGRHSQLPQAPRMVSDIPQGTLEWRMSLAVIGKLPSPGPRMLSDLEFHLDKQNSPALGHSPFARPPKPS